MAATNTEGYVGNTEDSSKPLPQRPTFSDRLPRPWLFPLLVYAAVWGLILLSWHVANIAYHHDFGWEWYFWYKDSGWYGNIVRHWYAPEPGVRGAPVAATFFPLYPLTIKVVSFLAGGHLHVAGLIATVIEGAAACLVIWALADRIRDRWLADRTVLLFSVFPGAMTLGMMYSEPLGVALAAGSLLAALNRKWLLAGLIAGFATAEHPTLIVLPVALGISALRTVPLRSWRSRPGVIAASARREWRALLSPVLAALGVVGYFAWIARRYGDFFFWFKLERTHFHHHFDFGVHEFRILTWSLPDMVTNANYYVMAIALVVLAVVGIWLMLAARVPLLVSAYTVLVIFTLVTSQGSGPLPRYVWTAFGIFIGYAAKLPRWLFWLLFATFTAIFFFSVGWFPDHPRFNGA